MASASANRISWRQQARRILFHTLRSFAIAYLLVLILFSIFQTRLIFQGASTQGTPESVVTPPPQSELIHLQAPTGVPISGLFGKALTPDGNIAPAYSNQPTLLYFYGNAMCMNDALEEFRQFRQLGANVIMVDYAGYGMSGGKPSERGCYDAADAAFNYVISRKDLNSQKLIPAGWSLGGAVAIDLASRHISDGHICGLITFSAFTSMTEVGKYHYPMLPVSFLLTHRFDSERKITSVRVPILMAHGRRDSIVPFSMSDRLAQAAGGPVERLISNNADHNDFFVIAEDDVNNAVKRFLKQFSEQSPSRGHLSPFSTNHRLTYLCFDRIPPLP